MDDAKDEEVRQWLTKSRRDLKVASVLLAIDELLLDSVVFHCQQAAEKAFKAYLTYLGQAFRKTHDLDVLVDLCSLSEPRFNDLREMANILTPYAVEFRYPSDVLEPERSEAEEALAMAESVLSFVVRLLPDDFQ